MDSQGRSSCCLLVALCVKKLLRAWLVRGATIRSWYRSASHVVSATCRTVHPLRVPPYGLDQVRSRVARIDSINNVLWDTGNVAAFEDVCGVVVLIFARSVKVAPCHVRLQAGSRLEVGPSILPKLRGVGTAERTAKLKSAVAIRGRYDGWMTLSNDDRGPSYTGLACGAT